MEHVVGFTMKIMGMIFLTLALMFCIKAASHKAVREEYKECEIVYLDGQEIAKDSVDPAQYTCTFEGKTCYLSTMPTHHHIPFVYVAH